jgi:hypothetical protein
MTVVVAVVVIAWLALGLPIGLVLGRALYLADRAEWARLPDVTGKPDERSPPS